MCVIKFDDVLLEHDGLPHVLSLAVHLIFLWSSRRDHSEKGLLFRFCCRTPPSCSKVIGRWMGGLGGSEDFSFSPSPLGTNQVLELIWPRVFLD